MLSPCDSAMEKKRIFCEMCRVSNVYSKDKKWGLQVIGWSNAQFINRLIELDANPKIIYLIRDPRDCMLSTIRTAIPSYPSMSPHLWKKIEMLRTNAKIQIIRYEDLVLQPKRTIEIICEFLEIQYTKEMLLPLSRKISRNEHPAIPDMELFMDRGIIDADVATRWKKQHYDEDLLDMNEFVDHICKSGYQTYSIANGKLRFVADGPFKARLNGGVCSSYLCEIVHGDAVIDIHCSGVFGVDFIEGSQNIQKIFLNQIPLEQSKIYDDFYILRMIDDAKHTPIDAMMYTWAHIRNKIRISPGIRIALYTASDASMSYLSVYCSKNLDKYYKIDCVIDSYKDGYFGQYPIVSLEEALKRDIDLIIITSSPFYKHIALQLEEHGLLHGKDFVGGCFCNLKMMR
jgi:hypothetical protein